jgi:hypothetical protein
MANKCCGKVLRHPCALTLCDEPLGFCRKVSWVVSIQARSWDIFLQRAAGGKSFMTIDFKGAHYPKAVIDHAVFFYVR